MENDFTEKEYSKILDIVRDNYEFISYKEIKRESKVVLWRHDIDFSPHRALSLAKLENEKQIKSTYFIQLSSPFYNIFESSIIEIIKEIIFLGHFIGLHFDPNTYNIKNSDDLEYYLDFEKKILETLFSTKVEVFSFHNPDNNILKYDNLVYSQMINTYSSFLKKEFFYNSDSNGYWRHDSLREFLKKGISKIHVLTHPNWWQSEYLLPRERILRALEGRKNSNIEDYDSLLLDNKRENIGK